MFLRNVQSHELIDVPHAVLIASVIMLAGVCWRQPCIIKRCGRTQG